MIVVFLLPDVAEQDWRGIDIVDRDIEEALDLVGMQIDGQYAIDAGRCDHLRHQLGGNRHTRGAWPAILARKAEVRNHGGDTRRRSTPGGIDHDQQFHQVFGGRRAGRLDDKRLATANVLENLDVDFAVAEAAYLSASQRDCGGSAQYPARVSGARYPKKLPLMPVPRFSPR